MVTDVLQDGPARPRQKHDDFASDRTLLCAETAATLRVQRLCIEPFSRRFWSTSLPSMARSEAQAVRLQRASECCSELLGMPDGPLWAPHARPMRPLACFLATLNLAEEHCQAGARQRSRARPQQNYAVQRQRGRQPELGSSVARSLLDRDLLHSRPQLIELRPFPLPLTGAPNKTRQLWQVGEAQGRTSPALHGAWRAGSRCGARGQGKGLW